MPYLKEMIEWTSDGVKTVETELKRKMDQKQPRNRSKVADSSLDFRFLIHNLCYQSIQYIVASIIKESKIGNIKNINKGQNKI